MSSQVLIDESTMIKLASTKSLYVRFHKRIELTRAVQYHKNRFKLVYEGWVDPKNYLFEDILQLVEYGDWQLYVIQDGEYYPL
jgi:hypothetical protein